MSGPVLELRGLRKSYGGTEVLRGVDLGVGQGEFLTLLGPSGSGKSTILRLVAGFAAPDGGEIRLAGQTVSFMPPASRNIGMVFQNYALFPHLSAGENIAYGLRMRGWPRARRAARVQEMLALVGLPGMGARLPRQLSGGQQQRVALARALAFAPRLLLMDEPLGALDRALRVQMTAELHRLHRETGATFLYVTHDRDEAMSLSDRVAIMRDGRIDMLAPPAELFERPRTAFAARFFGAHNVIAAELVAEHGDGTASVRCGPHELRSPMARRGPGAAMLAVPRSALGLVPMTDALAIEADIANRLYFGELLELTCRAPGLGELIATVPARGHAADAPIGSRRTLFLDASRCVVVDA